MSASLQNNTDFNPYAAPIHSSAEPQRSESKRAPLKRLKHVNQLAIIADLTYITLCCSFGIALYFFRGVGAEFSIAAFWISLFLLWYSVVAGLFRAKGLSVASIVTPLLLPIPVIGTIVFLFAKEDIKTFMIANGYRPRFLGFAVDDAQREAMDQDPNYTPSQSAHHDGSKRRHVFSIAECCIFLCFAAFMLVSMVPLLPLVLRY